MRNKEVDYCNDCGAEFTDFHYCELVSITDEQEGGGNNGD